MSLTGRGGWSSQGPRGVMACRGRGGGRSRPLLRARRLPAWPGAIRSWPIRAVEVDQDFALAHSKDDGFVRFGAGIPLPVDHALGDEHEVARSALDALGAAGAELQSKAPLGLEHIGVVGVVARVDMPADQVPASVRDRPAQTWSSANASRRSMVACLRIGNAQQRLPARTLDCCRLSRSSAIWPAGFLCVSSMKVEGSS